MNTRDLPLTMVRTVLILVAISVVAAVRPLLSEQASDSARAARTGTGQGIERPFQVTPASLPAEGRATTHEVIYFVPEQASVTDTAKVILDGKVAMFGANPTMQIVIAGVMSAPGTAAYDPALGTRRAEAVKAYLVLRGIDPNRIEIATQGEGELVVESPGELAKPEHEAGQFRLLVADSKVAAPKAAAPKE